VLLQRVRADLERRGNFNDADMMDALDKAKRSLVHTDPTAQGPLSIFSPLLYEEVMDEEIRREFSELKDHFNSHWY
jgi:hypothetical protein